VVQHLQRRAMPGVVYLHVPNGGYRQPAEAAIFSGLGVRAGAPDLLLCVQAEVAIGLDNALRTLERWSLLRGRVQ
jgi:hypothetical protein